MLFDTKLSNSSESFYLEPGLYHPITDIVEAKKTLIQEKHSDSETYIAVKVSRRTQKLEIHLANERSGPVYFSTDLGHNFASDVGNDFVVN